jgi:hypothetical protein
MFKRVHRTCASDIVRIIQQKAIHWSYHVDDDGVGDGDGEDGDGIGDGESKEEKVDEGKVGRSTLTLLLRSIHFIPTTVVADDEKDDNVLLGSMVGAFNNKSALGGLKRLGVMESDDRQQLVDQCRIRLMVCVNHCFRLAT